MTESEIPVPSAEMKQVIQQIVERYHPQKIVLFGSHAYGEPHEGSDLDLLVVVSRPQRHRERWQVAWELRRHSPLPLQIVFMGQQEFEETKDVVGGLAYPAHHWGKVLYEADA